MLASHDRAQQVRRPDLWIRMIQVGQGGAQGFGGDALEGALHRVQPTTAFTSEVAPST